MKIKATCPHCNKEIQFDPAVIMGSMKKTMTDAAKEQRRNAIKARWDKEKEKKTE